jgi:glutathione S-transferase
MTLKLHYHPLSSFCQKVLIALYEADTPFERNIVDLGNAAQRAALLKLWPMGKFPVLEDSARDWFVPEASIIIEYLTLHFPGPTKLIPDDPDQARQMRMRDRFFDLYVAVPMQKIVMDRLRPDGQHDPFGVAEAREQLRTAYGLINQDMATKTWAMGDAFSMADCAAAPALYYANLVQPFGDTQSAIARYFEQLLARPSFARAAREAEPYRSLFPTEPAP